MISVIYIIELIVSCRAAARLYIFFISESLPASCDREPRGSIVPFDVVPFWQINRLPLTQMHSHVATDCLEPLSDFKQLALLCLFILCIAPCLTFVCGSPSFFFDILFPVFLLVFFSLFLLLFRPPAVLDLDLWQNMLSKDVHKSCAT